MLNANAKRFLSFILVFSLFLPAAFAVDMNENEIQPRYTILRNFVADLDIGSSGLASVYSSVDAQNDVYTLSLEMELQRSTNGRTWSGVKSWSASQTGHISLDKTIYVSSGYSYRIHATATISNSSGRVVETATTDSSTIRY